MNRTIRDEAGSADSIAVPSPVAIDRGAEITARLERLPFSRFHLKLAAILGVGTFFDAFDSATLTVALTVVFTSLHIGFINAGFLISGTYVGQFAGAWIFGYLGERYGRKFAFVSSMALFGSVSVVTAFAWNFESLLVLRFIQGFGLGGEVPIAVALFNEFLRGRTRGLYGMLYETTFIWGAILTPSVGLGLFALFGPDLGWRLLFLVGGLPALHAIYAARRMPESVRWLIEKQRHDEADAIVRRIEDEPRRDALPPPVIRAPPQIKPTRIAELFQGIYRKRTIVVWIQWAVTYFVAHGQNIWLPTLYVRLGGLPVSYALALSIASYTVTLAVQYGTALATDVVGRRPLFIGGMFVIVLAGIYGYAAVVTFHTNAWPVLFSTAVFLSVGTAMNSIGMYVYTSELYPTRMRALGTSTGSSMNRLASIVAPLAIAAILNAKLGLEIVFLMFAAVGLIGLIAVAMGGIETRGRTLEELSK